MRRGAPRRGWVVAGVAAAWLGLAGGAAAKPTAPAWRVHAAAAQPSARLAPDAETLRAKGFAQLRAGERAAAARTLAQAAEATRTPRLWRLVGDLRFHQGDREGAVLAWKAGLAEAPDDLPLLERTAYGAVEVGDYAAAAEAQAEVVRHLEAHLAAGNATPQLAMGRFMAPDELLVRHLVRWSELATLAGDFTTGEQAARRLIRRAPARVEGHLALAYMHLQAAEYGEAEVLYSEVLKVDPHNTIALNNLGNVRYMDRDLDAAARQFEAVLEVEAPSAQAQSIALANLGELLQLQGAYRDAEALYLEARDAAPEGAWSYMGLASLYDVTGRYDAAVEVMIEGWERDASHLTRLNMHFFEPEWAWQRDALIAEIEGDLDAATLLWKRVLKGDVPALKKAADHHLRGLEQLRD
ncbi:MAG: tetratricopeptide repeat protein [Myxococcales bacterium]|nr:tetratricopeptide repeat protein [Myxococcales bacterium]